MSDTQTSARNDDEQLNSCDDLAREWNCHPYTVRRKIWSGELKAVRLGPRCVRVTNAKKRRYVGLASKRLKMNDTQASTKQPALSIADAAKALTLSERTIWRMIESGQIRSVKVSERRRIITAAEIDRILAGSGS